MKKFVIAAMIAAGVAMCAAVWPHGNVVEETPAPATETAVSARKRPSWELKQKRSPHYCQRKKKERFNSKKRPKKSNLNRR